MLIEELVDSTDEYLESTGSIEVPTRWTEYSHPRPVKVVVQEEQEDIIDVGHIGLDRGEEPVHNLHKANGATTQQSSQSPVHNLHKANGATTQQSSQSDHNNLHKASDTCRHADEEQDINMYDLANSKVQNRESLLLDKEQGIP